MKSHQSASKLFFFLGTAWVAALAGVSWWLGVTVSESRSLVEVVRRNTERLDSLEQVPEVERLLPVGSIVPFAGPASGPGGHDNVPIGWEVCDGRALDRDAAQWKVLWSVLGTSWGSGLTGEGAKPGVTEFNLPDLRGRFLRGETNDQSRDPDFDKRTNSEGNLRAMGVGSYQEDAAGEHEHLLPSGATETTGRGKADGFFFQGLHLRDSAVSTTGGVGLATETRPKNAYVLYIIKTKS